MTDGASGSFPQAPPAPSLVGTVLDKHYQIVKLISAEPDVLQPFSAVQEKMVAALKQNYIETQRRDFVDQIGSGKLDANPEAVASLRIRYDSPATSAPANTPAADPQAHGAN